MTPALLSAVLLNLRHPPQMLLIAVSVVYLHSMGYAPCDQFTLQFAPSARIYCENKQTNHYELEDHVFRIARIFCILLFALIVFLASQRLSPSSLNLFVRTVPLCLSHSANRHSLACLIHSLKPIIVLEDFVQQKLIPSDHTCFRFGSRGLTPNPARKSHPACPTPS